MRVRIAFNPPEDKEDVELTYLFIDTALGYIEDDPRVYRIPEYAIRGKTRMSLMFYELSVNEAERIEEIFLGEIAEDGFIKEVKRYESDREEKAGKYLFYRTPMNETARRNLERSPGHNKDVTESNIFKIIRSCEVSVLKICYDADKTDNPITLLTFIRAERHGAIEPWGGDDNELRDYIDMKIANERMPKNRRVRHPRRPRDRSRRSKTSEI